jgi:hypothetical protein
MVRWPNFIQTDHVTRKIINTSIYYTSVFNANFPTQIVNCIVMPAQKRRIKTIDLMIVSRTGQTPNLCRFTFHVIAVDTGNIVRTIPTTPAALDPTNAAQFPLLKWQTVFRAKRHRIPIVDRGQYLGIVFTGVGGAQNPGVNDLDLHPAVEVKLD